MKKLFIILIFNCIAIFSNSQNTNATLQNNTNINTNITIVEQNSTTVTTGASSGYSGKMGCKVATYSNEFNTIKNSIKSKDFDNTRKSQAKQVIKNKCFKAKQIKEIVELFDFENSKLEIAKYAYEYTYDQDNYYIVNDAFEFESSITELNKYVK